MLTFLVLLVDLGSPECTVYGCITDGSVVGRGVPTSANLNSSLSKSTWSHSIPVCL
ncbi:hypothetical protein HanPSC8_Chr02g0076471 [Helianthus annuus]|nr:hypothetical protein HanPSC8_Chr02g0076471 [Helianthus annuus]